MTPSALILAVAWKIVSFQRFAIVLFLLGLIGWSIWDVIRDHRKARQIDREHRIATAKALKAIEDWRNQGE